MRRDIGLLLAFLALMGCAQARSPAGTADATTGGARVPDTEQATPPEVDLSQLEASAPVQQAIAAARRHFEGPHYDEDVRVQSTTTGAFTRAGVEQRAVLYRMTLYPRGFPSKGLAILEGDRLVRNFAFTLLAEDVDTLRDFAGDGRDALALEGGFGMGGQYSRGLVIAAFGEDGLAELASASVYESICGMAREGSEGPTSAQVSVAPGGGFLIQRFRQSSCESTTWGPVGEPEPLEMNPPEKSPFEEIGG